MSGMWPWPCCCPDCVYFTDAFDRDNSSDLGVDWTEVAGDWSIASNKLSISSSNAVVACDELNPDGDTAVIATAILKGNAEGNQLRILVDYVDADNYWFGEVEWGPATGTGALRLYQRSGGTNTLKGRTVLTGAIVGSSVTLVVCIGAGRISVAVGAVLLVADATQSISLCGLATGSAPSTVTFDDFELSKHDIDDPECPECEEKPCLYFYDDFDRSDNAALGDDWTETAGVWGISTETLETSSANATCTCDCDEPEGNNALFAAVSCSGSAIGDILKLVADVCSLVVEWKAANKADVSFYDNLGQVGSTVEISLALESSIALSICLDGDSASAKAGANTIFWTERTTPSGSAVLLKTDTLNGTATFNNLTTQRHPSVLTDCYCHTVSCQWCKDDLAPIAWEVVLVCPNCEDLDGTYILYIQPGYLPGSCIYRHSLDPPVGGLTKVQIEMSTYGWLRVSIELVIMGGSQVLYIFPDPPDLDCLDTNPDYPVTVNFTSGACDGGTAVFKPLWD